jgi:hypothetical protein
MSYMAYRCGWGLPMVGTGMTNSLETVETRGKRDSGRVVVGVHLTDKERNAVR